MYEYLKYSIVATDSQQCLISNFKKKSKKSENKYCLILNACSWNSLGQKCNIYNQLKQGILRSTAHKINDHQKYW